MPDFRSGKPAWILGQSVNQAFAANAANDLVWDVVDWEDPVVFSAPSSVVVDRPGLYIIGATIERVSTASSSQVSVRLRVNGVTRQNVFQPAGNGVVGLNLVEMLKLDAGDVVTINATLHVTVATTTSAPNCSFWGSRVAPKRWT